MNAPRLLVADGHLGIWAAVPEIWPRCQEQRCWNHKMVNVLDQVPRKQQAADEPAPERNDVRREQG